MIQFFRSLVAFSATLALVTASITAAHAEPTPIKIDDPISMIEALAPDKPTTSSRGSTMRITTDKDAGRVTPEVLMSHGQFETSFLLSGSLKPEHVIGDFHVFAQDQGNLAAYVKPSPSGGQVYFAVASPAALSELYLELPIDVGAELVPAPGSSGGTTMLELADGRVMIFAEPWARSADGQDLQTSYRLEGQRLVQEVVTTPTTAYPVLADPAWQYAIKYDLGGRTPFSVQDTLHDCFNCKFPVSGAPEEFPAINQLLPLNVLGLGIFECRMGIETLVDEPSWVSYDYFFNATANHIDGAGSGITFSFQFFPGDSTYSMLVSAYIVNDFGGAGGQYVYVSGAAAQWAIFASNLYLAP